jgi:hypothetical protein
MAPRLRSASTYKHWGTGDDGREPVDPLKQCGVSHYNLTYDGAWGWAGELCTEPRVFICKISSECPPWCRGCIPVCL